MASDVVVLVGAPEEQVAHVDLSPGQYQAIVALTPSVPTLVFTGQSPTTEEALAMLEIEPTSTSRFADILRFAPGMALPRAEILKGMHTVLAGSSSSASASNPSSSSSPSASPSSSSSSSSAPTSSSSSAGGKMGGGACGDTWDPGTVFIADHTKIHAGPRQVSVEGDVPRMVLFTTFTVVKNKEEQDCSAGESKEGGAASTSSSSSSSSASSSAPSEPKEYAINDQFLPYGFAEDTTMSASRAQRLLQEWAHEKPWAHYPSNNQRTACQRLCLKNPVVDGKPYPIAAVVKDLNAMRNSHS
jgi:hypothetical protein